MLHCIPEDVLQYSLRPFLSNLDALNTLEACSFKIRLHAKASNDACLEVLTCIVIHMLSFTNSEALKTPDNVLQGMLKMKMTARDLLRISNPVQMDRWLTAFTDVLQINIDIIHKHLSGEVLNERLLEIDPLSLALFAKDFLDLEQFVALYSRKNEARKRRRRPT